MSLDANQLGPEDLSRLRELGKKNFYFFAKAILGFDWITKHVHMDVCNILQDSSNTRVKIVLPRGWLKSTIGTISYPLWRAVNNPEWRCLIVQNTFTNACKKLASIKAVVDNNELFRALYPEVIPNKRKHTWSSDAACLNRKSQHAEATFEVAGTRTKVTSRHYDCIIEDDTVAPDLDEMGEENILPTKDDITQAIGWHKLAIPLLVNPVESQILIIGTRWFEKDLISWNEENEKDYVSIYRACKEDSEGNPDADGVVTYPERFPEEVLDSLKAAMGPYLYSCLYLNTPIQSDTMIFRSEDIKYFEEPGRDLVCYTTIDLASDPEESKGKDIDYNVVLTAGKDLITGQIYVLDYFRERCNPSRVIDAIFKQVRSWNPVKVGLESIAYQKSMKYWIRERMKSEDVHFHVESITHGKQSKYRRIQNLQPIFCAGKISIRNYMTSLENELLCFPYGAHDDLIDCLSMQLPMWKKTISLDERPVEVEPDPRSFESIEKELYMRAEKTDFFTQDALFPGDLNYAFR